tara:strand:+ start:867 stop:1259 length:393 start_codon:yes stop_codon:yes gene_type:complete
MRKIKIVIDYEIQYANGFYPEDELQLAYFNPVSEKYEDVGDIFEVEQPLSDEKNFDVDESDGTYSNHEHRTSSWEVQYDDKIIVDWDDENFQLFQFNNGRYDDREYDILLDFDTDVIGKIETLSYEIEEL